MMIIILLIHYVDDMVIILKMVLNFLYIHFHVIMYHNVLIDLEKENKILKQKQQQKKTKTINIIYLY